MKAKKWVVVCLPFASALALLGCPEKTSGGSADAAASAAPSTEPAVQLPVQPTTSSTIVSKPIMPMPHLNIDAAAALVDAAVQMMDAGAAPPATGDAGATAATVPAECTQYAAQQEVCIGKMPAPMQGPARAGLAADKASWPGRAASGRDALLAQCKAQLAAANTCR